MQLYGHQGIMSAGRFFFYPYGCGSRRGRLEQIGQVRVVFACQIFGFG